MSKEDISDLLEHWFSTKTEINELEKKILKYKKVANRIMENKGINQLTSNNFILNKTDITRNTISKQDIPESIWNKYSHPCSYSSYILTPIKKK